MAFDYFGPDYVLPTAPSPEKGAHFYMVDG